MLTRINPRKIFESSKEAVSEIQNAISGDWGREAQKGLRVVSLGKCRIMSGLFGPGVTAVEVPPAEERYPAYFFDTAGNSAMVVVEKGVRQVKKPEQIVSDFSFFAMV